MALAKIKDFFYKTLERLSSLGENEKFSSWDNEKTKHLNQLLIVSTISSFFFAFFNALAGNTPLAIQGTALIVFNLIIFTLHYYQRQYFARLLTCFGYPLLFFSMTLAGKGEINGQYAFFLMLLLCVLFFRKTWRQIAILLYVAALYLSSEIILYFQSNQVSSWEAIINDTIIFIAIAGGLIFITDSFIRQIIITRKKNQQLVGELTNSTKELKRLNYMVSHDLRSPLRQIVSFSTLAQASNREGDSCTTDEYLSLMQDSARGLYALTEDLLSLAHLDKNQLKTNLIDLSQLFGNLQKQFYNSEEEARSIFIEEEHNNVFLEGNTVLIQMVLQNLIENGIKYNDNSNKKILLQAESHANCITIKVKDNGIGIPTAVKDQIFDIFQRFDHRGKYEGNGLGLAIAKKIMEVHGGSIQVVAQPSGSLFLLTFPTSQEDSSKEENSNTNSTPAKLLYKLSKQRRAIF